MGEINIIGAIIAGVAAFALGAVWYAPPVFGNRWMALVGLSEDDVKNANMVKIFGSSAVLSIAAALVFAAFLGDASLGLSIGAGFAAGLFWVAGSFGISYAFEQRPIGLLFINGGYHIVQFTLYGLIIGITNGLF